MDEKTIEEIEKLVKENNSDAMVELARRYFNGKGVQEDFGIALKYFEKAEKAGNIKGRYGIAKCYFYGRGLEQNYEKAYNIFYNLMTKYNDIDSKYYIGFMYYHGYFVKQNYEMAYNIFKEMADNGDIDAKKRIADMYYFGQYLPKDYEKSFEIFKDLYEKKNDKYSLMVLVYMYYYGRGTKQNFKKARELGELFEKDNDDKNTAYFLGEIYYYGKDTEINYEKAAYYFEKSLDERYDDAYFYLGQIYKNGGYGIEKDTQKSRYYLLKVEKDICQVTLYYIMGLGQYNSEKWIETLNYDREYFGRLLKNFPYDHISITYFNKLKTLKDDQYRQMAEIIKNKITKFYEQKQPYFSLMYVANEEEIDILSEIIIDSSEYNTMDDYLKIKIDQENDKRLLYMVGRIFYDRTDCQKDIQKGTNFLIKSANQGYPYAIFEIARIAYHKNNKIEALEKLNSLLNEKDEFLLKYVKNLLGKIYYYGAVEIKKDYKKAFKYFSESEKEITSKEHLGKCYYYGQGVEKNYQKALDIFKSIENSSRLSQYYLGEMYRLGEGVLKNFEQAYIYYKKAAEENYPQAQYQLGQAYLLGEGTSVEIDKAIFWFEKSAKEGIQEAKEKLEEIKNNTHYLEETNNNNSNKISHILQHMDNND